MMSKITLLIYACCVICQFYTCESKLLKNKNIIDIIRNWYIIKIPRLMGIIKITSLI